MKYIVYAPDVSLLDERMRVGRVDKIGAEILSRFRALRIQTKSAMAIEPTSTLTLLSCKVP